MYTVSDKVYTRSVMQFILQLSIFEEDLKILSS